jgi:hypothetical protein
MRDPPFGAAQKGTTLAEAMPYRSAAAAKQSRSQRSRGAHKRQSTRAARGSAPHSLPAPPILSRSERLRVLSGFETVIGSVYAHLPLKRARYGFDPVQRLRILRTQVDAFDDNNFHAELAAILTQMRDYHTRYTGPAAFEGKVAVLPFLVDLYGPEDSPTYVVTKVGKGLDAGFVPGVLLQYWNGVPIDLAVLRHSNEECAGRPDSVRAASLQSLTFRSLQFGPPPDEEWVIVGYRKVNAAGRPSGALKELRIAWRVVDPTAVAALLPSAPSGKRAARLRRAMAVNPAAAAVRMAKMLLFAPEALTGAKPPDAPHVASRAARRRGNGGIAATTIDTTLPDTLRVQTLQVQGRSFGYLRIWGFDTDPDKFITELLRVIPLLPTEGLIIDVRSNPGGYIVAAERALQLFTSKRIEPVRFSALATPFTRDMAVLAGLEGDLDPWKASLQAAVRNGELYAQPLPITAPAECNDIAVERRYAGPVVLVGDTNTYSSGDIFAAGFVDHGIGPFVCVGAATGAGGANVWDYAELRRALAGTPLALPSLPAGIGLTFSFRRITRSGPSEGLTIEDVGVPGMPYAMTRNDLLFGNGDLLLHCVALLRRQR